MRHRWGGGWRTWSPDRIEDPPHSRLLVFSLLQEPARAMKPHVALPAHIRVGLLLSCVWPNEDPSVPQLVPPEECTGLEEGIPEVPSQSYQRLSCVMVGQGNQPLKCVNQLHTLITLKAPGKDIHILWPERMVWRKTANDWDNIPCKESEASGSWRKSQKLR